MRMPGFTAVTSIYTSAASYSSMLAGLLQGESTSVIPAQFDCTDFERCSACIPTGPSIFSPGRQFCRFFTCRPNLFGGCRCRERFKGFVPCDPSDDLVLKTG
jgi:hypothetical protein